MGLKQQQLKYLTPFAHILFWMLLFFLPYILRLTSTGVRMSDNMQFRLVLNNCVLIAFFYFNAYFLYPRIYKSKGLLLYALSVVLAVVLCMKATSYVEKKYLPQKHIQNQTAK